MNIGQVAAHTSLSAKTIRYYEEIGLVVPLRQQGNDYRDYSEADIRQLSFLQRARAVGFRLNECRELLELFRNPQRQAVNVKQLVLDKLQQLDEQLKALQAMRTTLADMAAQCSGDTTSYCAIIDNLAGHETAAVKPLMPFTLVDNTDR